MALNETAARAAMGEGAQMEERRVAPAERLSAAAKQIALARAQGGTAELRIAELLYPILVDWESLREAAGGIGAREWAEAVTGNPQAAKKAVERVRAMERLTACLGNKPLDSDFVRYRLHHQSVVYLAGAAVPEEKRRAVLVEVMRETVVCGILEPSQARAIARQVLDARPGKRRRSALVVAIETYGQQLDEWAANALRAALSLRPIPELPEPLNKDVAQVLPMDGLREELVAIAAMSEKPKK